ncbi:MAG TPA: nucleotidyltransferase family protein [Tepidisphaeraceae bacterium]|jgi:molybdenum cofactor cytidylyltransferase|nr:nucleotidyltransferase family protein [Tepidisphaeraceae bacterium]
MDGDSIEFGLILLAAGGSVRMGRPKQLLPWRGRPLLRHAAESAIASGPAAVIVVLGAAADEARAVLAELPVHPIVNDRWQAGMGSSLKLGLSALLAARPAISAAIIMLADQPMVGESAIRELLAAHRQTGKPICAAVYAGTLGAPVLFAASQFDKLAAIGDNEGAKRLLARSPGDVAAVLLAAGSMDIDTPDDYHALTDGAT